jgi:hypothetical protein
VLNEMQRKGIDVDRIEVRDQPVDPPPAGGRP